MGIFHVETVTRLIMHKTLTQAAQVAWWPEAIPLKFLKNITAFLCRLLRTLPLPWITKPANNGLGKRVHHTCAAYGTLIGNGDSLWIAELLMLN